MRDAVRRLRLALLLVPAIGLAACGGDGTKLVAIDQSNAEDVAASALGAAEFVSSMAHMVDDLVDLIEDATSGSLPCPGGGTMDVVINDVAPLGEISAGDSVSIRFINCVLEFGGDLYTANGRLEFNITSAAYPGGEAYDILLRATFSNLALSAFGTTITVNGGFNLQLETPDGIVFTTVTTGSSLKAAIQIGAIVATNSVSSFMYTEVYDDGSGDYTVSGHGRVYDAALGASFDSEITVPLMGTDPDDPDTGQFECLGAGNSSVLLVVIDDVNVELRVDENGDGTPEFVIPTTWSSLRGDA